LDPRETIEIGVVNKSWQEIEKIIETISDEYPGNSYDIFRR
jgi:hypothetical protein